MHVYSKCSYLPAQQSAATLMPLYKKSVTDPDDTTNYRPLLDLTFLSKIVEHIVTVQLKEYLTANGLPSRQQSACVSGHSTQAAMLRVMLYDRTITKHAN
jgi:hypothetical protein